MRIADGGARVVTYGPSGWTLAREYDGVEAEVYVPL